jgi:hypothetical protein
MFIYQKADTFFEFEKKKISCLTPHLSESNLKIGEEITLDGLSTYVNPSTEFIVLKCIIISS